MRPCYAALALLAGALSLTPAASGNPPSGAADPALQVTGIDIDVTLDVERGIIEETVALTVVGRRVQTLQFKIDEGLSVERSKSSSGVILHRKAGSRLIASVDPPLDGARTLTFVLSGRPGGAGGTRVDPAWVVLNPVDHWYPTLPSTLARTRVRIRAPEGWTAVAPGAAVVGGANGVWEWQASKPVRRVAVGAAPGLKIEEGRVVSTTVRVASSNPAHSIEALSAVLLDPMAWFAGALAPYPFDGFNLMFLKGIPRRVSAGGMLIVPDDTPVAQRSDAADLIAGQWFGEFVAGDGRWIDSFAAWEAVTYCRDRTYPIPEEIDRLRNAYLEMVVGDVALVQADVDTPDEVVRGKGSAVPEIVRLTAGNRAFFQAIGDLFQTPAASPMTLEEIRQVFEQRAGQSLEKQFSEWFERTDVPNLEAKLRTRPSSTGGFRADLTLVQKRFPYTLPVEVVFYGPGETHRETVKIADDTTNVFYILPFEPTRVELDPLDRIYRRKDSPKPGS